MTDQQIRLHFGELNAAEMRLARAIVGWHEREQAKLCAAADGLAEAVKSISTWRDSCDEYDEDMGYPQRDYDEEQVEMIEKEASKALAAYQATKP